MGAGVSKIDKDKVKKAISDGNEGLMNLLTEISEQSFAALAICAKITYIICITLVCGGPPDRLIICNL